MGPNRATHHIYDFRKKFFNIEEGRAKRSKLSTTTDNRLNHLLMTHIYNEEFKKIKINNYKRVYRSEGEWRSLELLLLGCINFEHFLI